MFPGNRRGLASKLHAGYWSQTGTHPLVGAEGARGVGRAGDQSLPKPPPSARGTIPLLGGRITAFFIENEERRGLNAKGAKNRFFAPFAFMFSALLNDCSDDGSGRRHELVFERDEETEVRHRRLRLNLRFVALACIDYLAQTDEVIVR